MISGLWFHVYESLLPLFYVIWKWQFALVLVTFSCLGWLDVCLLHIPGYHVVAILVFSFPHVVHRCLIWASLHFPVLLLGLGDDTCLALVLGGHPFFESFPFLVHLGFDSFCQMLTCRVPCFPLFSPESQPPINLLQLNGIFLGVSCLFYHPSGFYSGPRFCPPLLGLFRVVQLGSSRDCCVGVLILVAI